jgi:hypothetical protein
MTSKQGEYRHINSDIEEEDNWEYLVPDRFKKVCTKENFEPFHASHPKDQW